jgi:hypothetical protein
MLLSFFKDGEDQARTAFWQGDDQGWLIYRLTTLPASGHLPFEREGKIKL